MTAFPHRIRAPLFLDIFLISAVSSVLTARFFLKITNNFQLTRGELHIAHILYGGLFMVLAIILLLSFLSNISKYLAATLGGFGFGLFVDEIGKFITRDNNYFYQPAIPLVYLIFVLLYILIQSISKKPTHSATEYLSNTLDLLITQLNSPTKNQKFLLEQYLAKSPPNHPLTKALREFISQLPKPRTNTQNAWENFRSILNKIVKNHYFRLQIISFFVLKTLFDLSTSIILLLDSAYANLGFLNISHAVSTIVAGIFAVMGIVTIRRRRLALRLFRYSVLISILLTQVFAFYQNQLSALISLALNIIVFFTLRLMSAEIPHKKH